MADTEKLLPVTLPSWPSCDQCLSWSEDDLAIAGGEFVHIVTPKLPSIRTRTVGHPQWHLHSLRVNLFRQDEWPEQSPTTIPDLSIGEEQSLSHVAALAWSASGLGVYRRSILAVLTSNLILSIWERSGSQAQYSRTIVINKYATPELVTTGYKHDRRALRIRSFAWLPPLKTKVDAKWGLHYLLVVDDYGQMIVFHVFRLQSGASAKWNLKTVTKLSLDDLNYSGSRLETMSPLQRRLHLQSPVTKIEPGPWIGEEVQPNINDGEGGAFEAFSRIVLWKGGAEYVRILRALVSNNGQQISFSVVTDTRPGLNHKTNQVDLQMSSANSQSTTARAIDSPDLFFKRASQPLTDDFDQNFQLSGHLRTRFWGSTLSADGSQAVACITIHPSDMIEHTIPSTEKCMLVFENTGMVRSGVPMKSKSDRSIQEDIVHVAYRILKEQGPLESSLDRRLFQTYCCLAGIVQGQGSELKLALEALQSSLQIERANKQADQTLSNNQANGAPDHVYGHPEECEICDASIAFTADTKSGYCDRGHQFSRCQLSFLTVQEPGISKYCSQCGKQFLDLMKLGSTSGPSFAQLMFDEYDVCPYCQGKFTEEAASGMWLEDR